MADYSRRTFTDALRAAGVRPGDVVFSHSNVGFLGVPEEGRGAEVVCETALGAFQDALGPEGTLVVPTFTYSACKGQAFDPETTPSSCGLFTEFVRARPGAVRSLDPIFSVAALGARAAELTREVGEECFGEQSVWGRLHEVDALLCNINLDAGSTFLHWVERRLGVAYRYDKLFRATVVVKGVPRPARSIFFCQDLGNADTVAAFEPFHRLAIERGRCRVRPIGRGGLVAMRARAASELISEELRASPWLLTAAGREGRAPRLPLSPPDRVDVRLPPGLPALEVLERVRRIRCDAVSSGVESIQDALLELGEGTRRVWPTGQRVGPWLVPERWTCAEASLNRVGGAQEWSLAEDPHGIVSYSAAVDAELDGAVLLERCAATSESEAETEAPGTGLLLARAWRLSLDEGTRARLDPRGRYRLRIDARLAQGRLSVVTIGAHGAASSPHLVVALGPEGAGPLANAATFAAARAATHAAGASARLVVTYGALGLRAWSTTAPAEAEQALLLVPAQAGEPVTFRPPRAWPDRVSGEWAGRLGVAAERPSTPWGCLMLPGFEPARVEEVCARWSARLEALLGPRRGV